jgi:hypothetical protein
VQGLCTKYTNDEIGNLGSNRLKYINVEIGHLGCNRSASHMVARYAGDGGSVRYTTWKALSSKCIKASAE